jgi:lauroyl/myristoyl acyltransferase
MATLRKLIRSLAIAYIYFAHVSLLRLIGPYSAVLLTRGLCYLHWMLTLVTPAGRDRRAMSRVLPRVQPTLSLRTAHRRYLAVKHQYFVEHHVYPTTRGRRFVAQTYGPIEGREHLKNALAKGRGVILLAHHFGMSRMIYPALRELGYDNHHHKIEDATHARGTFRFVARAVIDKLRQDEQACGLNVIHHRPGATFERIADLLQRNAIVGIAGDGAAGAHFLDVPFLGAAMPFPTGPARLAARTGAPIITAVCLLAGLWRHRLVLHPPIYCQDDSPATLQQVVREYAGLLDQHTRRQPWQWWTWRRLDIEESADGQLRLVPRAPATATADPSAPPGGAGDGPGGSRPPAAELSGAPYHGRFPEAASTATQAEVPREVTRRQRAPR